MKDIKNDTLNNVLGSATEKLPKKGSVLPSNREGQEKKIYPVKELKIIKNEEYCFVYCHNCGSMDEKLLEISNDIQNYIAFCFLCIQKAFKKK